MEQVCEAIRHGSLMGARGNSGVILSQILRGLADTFAPLEAISAPDVIAGPRGAPRTPPTKPCSARSRGRSSPSCVSRPKSVEQASASGEASLADVLERAATAARDAVASTPDLLPVLRDAGVVDAGGRGFELLLSACLNVVAERPVPAPEHVHTPAAVAAHLARRRTTTSPSCGTRSCTSSTPPTTRSRSSRTAWGGLGDSIVVVGGDGLWNCHVHTNDIGGAIEAGIVAGRPAEIRVTDLHEQVEEREEEAWVREQTEPVPRPVEHVTTGVVAVAVGDGLQRLFASLGVQHVVAGGQSMNPSTAQILEAVQRCAADSVIVLPNNKNIVPVARQVPDLADRPGRGRAHHGGGRGARRVGRVRLGRVARGERRDDGRGRDARARR